LAGARYTVQFAQEGAVVRRWSEVVAITDPQVEIVKEDNARFIQREQVLGLAIHAGALVLLRPHEAPAQPQTAAVRVQPATGGGLPVAGFAHEQDAPFLRHAVLLEHFMAPVQKPDGVVPQAGLVVLRHDGRCFYGRGLAAYLVAQEAIEPDIVLGRHDAKVLYGPDDFPRKPVEDLDHADDLPLNGEAVAL
jgi:hypothetical protein